MNFKNVWMKCSVAVLAALALPFAADAQQFTFKYGGIATNDPGHEFMKVYKERLEAKSGGRIKVEVYPGAQLGGFPQMIQAVQLGTQEAVLLPPGFLRGVDPRVQVIDAPGMFESMEHGQKTVTDPRFHDRDRKSVV